VVSVTTYEVNNYNPGDQKYVVTTHNKQKLDYIYTGYRNLTGVADTFKVRESDIRYWNNIAWGNSPKPNQYCQFTLRTNSTSSFTG